MYRPQEYIRSENNPEGYISVTRMEGDMYLMIDGAMWELTPDNADELAKQLIVVADYSRNRHPERY